MEHMTVGQHPSLAVDPYHLIGDRTGTRPVVVEALTTFIAKEEELVSEADPYADKDPAVLASDAQAPATAPVPGPSADSAQGPPEGWEVIDADGKGTGRDAYGNPVEPTPVEPAPQSEPPEGWEVIDADGKGTGRDAYGNPVSQP
jgi:hypothetical protein